MEWRPQPDSNRCYRRESGKGTRGDHVLRVAAHPHIARIARGGANIQVLSENTGTLVRMIEQHYEKFLRADRRAMFDKVQGLVARRRRQLLGS